MSKITRIVLSLFLFFVHSCSAIMTFDNRFYPSFQKPYVTVGDRLSHFALDVFVGTASEAIGIHDNIIGLCEIFGEFDQGQLSDALDCAGLPNPLIQQFRGAKIPWAVNGKLQLQGFSFSSRQRIFRDWLSVGFYWGFMRVNSSHEFRLKESDVTLTLLPADKDELDEMRRQMFSVIGLNCSHGDQVGMGDMDFYVRFGKRWDYTYKMRHVDLGFRFGALIPAGVKRFNSSAPSIPFGGNGHWGLYGSFDVELEVKEDMKAGLLLRLSKRVSKTKCHRLSVKGEPHIFGAILGDAKVTPGFTFVFSPYVSLENLRSGFGARLNFTIVKHGEDQWCDKRCDQAIPVTFEQVIKRSPWGLSYFTLNFFYDFGATSIKREFDPIVVFSWDVPTQVFEPERSYRTHKVSLGLEFTF